MKNLAVVKGFCLLSRVVDLLVHSPETASDDIEGNEGDAKEETFDDEVGDAEAVECRVEVLALLLGLFHSKHYTTIKWRGRHLVDVTNVT